MSKRKNKQPPARTFKELGVALLTFAGALFFWTIGAYLVVAGSFELVTLTKPLIYLSPRIVIQVGIYVTPFLGVASLLGGTFLAQRVLIFFTGPRHPTFSLKILKSVALTLICGLVVMLVSDFSVTKYAKAKGYTECKNERILSKGRVRAYVYKLNALECK